MPAAVPLGSSSTEWPLKHIAIRHFCISFLTFSTFRFLSRNSTSIGNFIPIVWTASQGAIQSPSPGPSLVCFKRPVRRCSLVSAISAHSARTVPLDRLRIRSFDKEWLNPVRDLLLRSPETYVLLRG